MVGWEGRQSLCRLKRGILHLCCYSGYFYDRRWVKVSLPGIGLCGDFRGEIGREESVGGVFFLEEKLLSGMMVLVVIYSIYDLSCYFMESLALEFTLLPISSRSLNLVGVLVGLIWRTLLRFGVGVSGDLEPSVIYWCLVLFLWDGF